MTEDFDPRFDPAFQPGYDPKTAVPVSRAQETRAEDTPAETPIDPNPVDPNPFERILWGVAAVLLVGGIAITIWSNSVSYYTVEAEWTWQQVLQQSSWALSTPMITVGLATGVGLLFRRAAQWKPEE